MCVCIRELHIRVYMHFVCKIKRNEIVDRIYFCIRVRLDSRVLWHHCKRVVNDASIYREEKNKQKLWDVSINASIEVFSTTIQCASAIRFKTTTPTPLAWVKPLKTAFVRKIHPILLIYTHTHIAKKEREEKTCTRNFAFDIRAAIMCIHFTIPYPILYRILCGKRTKLDDTAIQHVIIMSILLKWSQELKAVVAMGEVGD